MLQFEWDEDKNRKNDVKHGILFEEAIFIWKDPFAVEFHDRLSSVTEERWIRIGINPSRGLLVVVFCEREEFLRVISARKATLTERRGHERRIRF